MNPNSHYASVAKPHFDDDKTNLTNYFGHKILPAYSGQHPGGNPMAMADRPYEANLVWWQNTWTMTVAADYQVVNAATGTFADYILGCVSFTWYDGLGRAILTLNGVPGPNGPTAVAIKEPTLAGYSVMAAPPDAFWKDALANW